MRELKKEPIYKEEWYLKNGFVYGKPFLRMLNTINTRFKQRKTEMQLEEHRKVYPEVSSLSNEKRFKPDPADLIFQLKNLPNGFITFDTHLPYQLPEDTNQEEEDIISVEATRFTINFSPSERVTFLFSGSNEDRWCLTSLTVIETSPGLESFTTRQDQEDDTFDWALVAKCAEKFTISEASFSVLFSDIFDFPQSIYQPYWDHGVLYAIMDLEKEHYKLAADKVQHPAETFLIHVVDSLLGTQFSYNMAITNLVDTVLQ